MYNADNALFLWKRDTSDHAQRDDHIAWKEAYAEAERCAAAYNADVQFVFSHVQHHWHDLDQQGNRAPLKYCRLKGRKEKHICKMGFLKPVPVRQDKNLEQREVQSSYRLSRCCR